MIFVTIGTQEPFDRLIKLVDNLALSLKEYRIVAQVIRSNYNAKNIEVVDFVSPDDFEKLFNDARLIISHAGMGSIITALTMGKPIIVMSRLASLGEHRNEHQLATVKKMGELEGVYVVNNEEELAITVRRILMLETKVSLSKFSREASGDLIESIKDFIKSIKE
jgi:UDP-N-acetylglucosamine transferase subunit ALG13